MWRQQQGWGGGGGKLRSGRLMMGEWKGKRVGWEFLGDWIRRISFGRVVKIKTNYTKSILLFLVVNRILILLLFGRKPTQKITMLLKDFTLKLYLSKHKNFPQNNFLDKLIQP